MPKGRWIGGAILLSAALFGCSKPYAVFRKDGIYFARYFYLVRFSDRDSKQIVSRDWILDNFHHDGEGYVINKGKEYRGYFMIDRDGDGKHEKEPTYIFDLKLKHRTASAVIWIQNIELPFKDANKSLEVLLGTYVRSLTGAGFYAEGNMFSVLTVKQKRYVAVARHRAWTRLGPYRAITATIQIVNVDQMKVQPGHRGDMIQVTLAKVFFKGKRYKKNETIWGNSVMIAGYYNSASDFKKRLEDYRRLLVSLRFDTSWTRKHKGT